MAGAFDLEQIEPGLAPVNVSFAAAMPPILTGTQISLKETRVVNFTLIFFYQREQSHKVSLAQQFHKGWTNLSPFSTMVLSIPKTLYGYTEPIECLLQYGSSRRFAP